LMTIADMSTINVGKLMKLKLPASMSAEAKSKSMRSAKEIKAIVKQKTRWRSQVRYAGRFVEPRERTGSQGVQGDPRAAESD
jgi:hypothetical protein